MKQHTITFGSTSVTVTRDELVSACAQAGIRVEVICDTANDPSTPTYTDPTTGFITWE